MCSRGLEHSQKPPAVWAQIQRNWSLAQKKHSLAQKSRKLPGSCMTLDGHQISFAHRARRLCLSFLNFLFTCSMHAIVTNLLASRCCRRPALWQTELNLSVLVVCPITLSYNYFHTFSCTQRRKRKSFSSTGRILNITLAAESSQLLLQNMPGCPVSSTGFNLLEVLPMFADPIVTGRSLLVFCHFLIPCKQ